MQIKILFLTTYAIMLLNYSNVFAAKEAPCAEKGHCLQYAASAEITYNGRRIASGIDIDTEETSVEEFKGFTALHKAAYLGLDREISRLIAAGAEINKPVGRSSKLFPGYTALQLAIIRGHTQVVYELLIKEPINDILGYFIFFLTSIHSQAQQLNQTYPAQTASIHIKAFIKEITEVTQKLIQVDLPGGIKENIAKNYCSTLDKIILSFLNNHIS